MDTPTNPDSKPRYDKRYVAFLDILGFRNLIEKTVRDRDLFDAVLEACESLAWEKSFADDLEMIASGAKNPPHTRRLYMFSDCIYCTTMPTSEGIKELFESVSRLCKSLIYTGVFVRGAIVLGEVYEKDRVIFGPGVIAAYDNESKAAKFPRVLVTDEIYAQSQSIEYTVGGRSPMWLKDQIRRDSDGLYHLDWLRHYHRIYEPGAKGFRTDGPLDFRVIKNFVEYWLGEAKGRVDIQSKMRWFAGYFNEVLARGKELNILGKHTSLAPIEF
jgi:hypothetical protein